MRKYHIFLSTIVLCFVGLCIHMNECVVFKQIWYAMSRVGRSWYDIAYKIKASFENVFFINFVNILSNVNLEMYKTKHTKNKQKPSVTNSWIY